jgi:hypothetical protein
MEQADVLGQRVLRLVGDLPPGPGRDRTHAVGAAALQALGVDPEAPVSERSIRVSGALAALAVLALAAHRDDDPTRWRPQIVATCFDALGHGRAGTDLPTTSELES